MISTFERSSDSSFTNFTDHGKVLIDSYVLDLIPYLMVRGYHLIKYISIRVEIRMKMGFLKMKHCMYGSTLAEMATGGSSGVYNL